jgi:hypothetical protein
MLALEEENNFHQISSPTPFDRLPSPAELKKWSTKALKPGNTK